MRYFVESYGCTMNFGEGRMLAEEMSSLGYVQCGSAEEADIVVLNTCTVVATTEKRMIARISELKKEGKEVVVTGCMAKVQPNRIQIRLPDAPIVPPREYGHFSQTIIDRFGVAGPPQPVNFGNDAIIPIAQGCLGACTYCITRFARGALMSYPQEDLVSRFRTFVNGGSKEILVTAQDTACYGADTGTNLAELLRSMLETDGEYRVRIGMMNPNRLGPIAEDLLSMMDDDRLYRFLHIPVQSGSDRVLERMRRGYTASGFMELVDTLRTSRPDISIATDIITGFPGETDEDHELTKELVRNLRADTLNITRFSARPGTVAEHMEPVHGRIVKERSTELTDLKNETELDVNKGLVGKDFVAMATEHKDGTVMRTNNYRPIVVKEKLELGGFHRVHVDEARSTYLIGHLA